MGRAAGAGAGRTRAVVALGARVAVFALRTTGAVITVRARRTVVTLRPTAAVIALRPGRALVARRRLRSRALGGVPAVDALVPAPAGLLGGRVGVFRAIAAVLRAAGSGCAGASAATRGRGARVLGAARSAALVVLRHGSFCVVRRSVVGARAPRIQAVVDWRPSHLEVISYRRSAESTGHEDAQCLTRNARAVFSRPSILPEGRRAADILGAS